MLILNKTIYKFIFTAILLVGSFLMADNILAQTGDILDIEFETGTSTPLFSKANFLPGDSVTRWVKVTNKTDDRIIPIVTKAEDVTDNGLGSELVLTILEEGIIIPVYPSKRLDYFFNMDGVYLSNLAPGASTTYNFIINFNETAGNDFQGKIVGFDIIVGDGTNESIGGEDDGGGGSGGGYYYNNLRIYNENIEVGYDWAVVKWNTNIMASSRVVYATSSHTNISNTYPPNYGYATSTGTYNTPANPYGTTTHEVSLSDLKSNTIYYFRPISSASPEKYGRELFFTTTNNKDEVIVLGEEALADLTVEKIIGSKFVNPGDINIEYKIIITNNGQITAYNVVAVENLSDGLVYSGTNQTAKTWDLGDIGPGEYKSVAYLVDVNQSAASGVYTSITEVRASNHDLITASADFEVRGVDVLGLVSGVLEGTGFSVKEFTILILALIILISSAIILRKKYL